MVYNGQWFDDQRNGFGHLVFGDGRKYVGSFSNSKKHGRGKFTWTNGDCYEGDWQENTRHGRGIYYFKDGRSKDAEWKDDKEEGLHKITYTGDNKVEYSRWSDGKKIEVLSRMTEDEFQQLAQDYNFPEETS